MDPTSYFCNHFKSKYEIMAGTSVMWSHRLKVQVHEFSKGICFKPQTVYGSFKVRTETGHVKCGIAERYNVKGKITWYKDCHSIQGPKYVMIHRELAIIGVNQQDAGYYTCQFTHEHNGTLYNVTQTKMMTVKAPSATLFPVIASPKNGTIEVVLGSSLNITCSAFLGYGKQIFDFLWWEVNGVRVGKENSSRFVIRTDRSTFNESYTSAVLTISEVRKEDLLSNFVCTALNSLGWEESIVRLTEKATDIRTYLCTSFFILVNMVILILVVCKFFRVDAVLLYRDVFQPIRSTDDGKMYDAYVIFARKYHIYDDTNDPVQYFVYNILLDVLEKKCGFTLYVQGRNLLPGEDMSTAADWAISKSRRLILILSSELVEAEEIAIEQQFGLYSALVSSDLKVIVIEMEKIGDESKLQESLRHIIKKKGTIKWQSCKASDKMSLKSRFWKQVRYEMPGRKSPPSNTTALKDKPMDLPE
ncbi:interleukin-1 receptor-like 1 isoform X2 [Ambystoma mexicanum]|uniref:interleukin-1 receptor-like 1 isoform X2 n=1 Tax=Ambystoma mexicanum TaxID=8296 RepID=UPI0037E8B5C4